MLQFRDIPNYLLHTVSKLIMLTHAINCYDFKLQPLAVYLKVIV